ncbi:MAG: hypothetical protein ACI8TQ_002201 [Planctomycetota bacterium]|jgi:hypothetical protein
MSGTPRFPMKKLLTLLALTIGASAPQAQDFFDKNIVRTVDLQFLDVNWEQMLRDNYASQVYILADMTVEGVVYPDVGVRIRGNSSFFFLPSGSQKFSLGIKVDFTTPGQDVMGVETINFNNAFSDPTFCREVAYFNILAEWIPNGRANHVNVTLNGQNWGIYANVQQYNKKVLRDWFDDEDGLRIKCANNPGGPGLQYKGTNPNQYNDYDISDDGGLLDPLGALIEVCDAVDNNPPAQWRRTDQIFAVDPSIWTVAMENLFGDEDSYVFKGCDFTLYQNPVDGRMHLHQTDGNESWTEEDWESDQGFSSPSKPFLNVVLSEPTLRGRYYAHLRTLINETFDPVALEAEFIARRNLIDPFVQADPKKLYSYAAFLNNFYTTVSFPTFGSPRVGIVEYINARIALLSADAEVQAEAPVITNLEASSSTPGVLSFITATVTGTDPIDSVTLYYRHKPADQYSLAEMFDDGLSGDGAAGDGVYGVVLPVIGVGGDKITYYVGATANNAFMAQSFLPNRTEIQPAILAFQGGVIPTDVVINESLAQNNTTIQDPAGSFEDYIELYNKSAAAVDVSLMYLTDNLSNPDKWQIPAGNIIPAGGTLLVWADNDPLEGPLHATFKLSSVGEEIGLFDVDGVTLLDSFIFGPQEIDISSGRLTDGSDPLVTFGTPTPLGLNFAGCGVRSYDHLDPLIHQLDLAATGTGAIGTGLTLAGTGFQPMSTAYLLLGFSAQYAPFTSPDLVALLNLFKFFPMGTGATGTTNTPLGIPLDGSLVGADIYFQYFGADPGGSLAASNAIHVNICP